MDGITSPKCDTHVSNLFVLYYAEILTIFFKENKKNNNIWKNVSWFFINDKFESCWFQVADPFCYLTLCF